MLVFCTIVMMKTNMPKPTIVVEYLFYGMWLLITLLPFLGFKLESGDMLSSSIAYAGLTIGVAILIAINNLKQ